MSSSPDNLLDQARGGDRGALGQLLAKHMPALKSRFTGRIPRRWRSQVSVEDVVQQACTDAFLSINRFEGRTEESFAAWLFTIADHNLANALRMFEAEKRGGDHRRIGPRSREDSLADLYEVVATTQSTPSRHAARNEAGVALQRAIERLPQEYRLVVEMFDLDNRSSAEVAKALRRSKGAMYMIRARAIRWLGELLGSVSRLLTTG